MADGVRRSMSLDVQAVQKDLKAANLDGWLFYDFRGRDPIALRILQLPPGMRTRRWFYFVPTKGQPRKLVHKIESESLATLPGETLYYAGQGELQQNLQELVGDAQSIAMQYSPRNAIPYVSMVDAGTIELVRSVGPKIFTSADLVQEYDAADLMADEGPDVAVGPNASDPHYGPVEGKSSPIREGELLLLDVWAKKKTRGSVYYDVTWTGFLGKKVPDEYAKVFNVVREARDKAINLILSSIAKGKPLQGWQVDSAARGVIDDAGYGKYFFHRTGHSIGESVHGNGVNMDGLETRDSRHLIARTCTSIEPGIYLQAFGIRSEVNVYIGEKEARVTGAVQQELLPLLA